MVVLCRSLWEWGSAAGPLAAALQREAPAGAAAVLSHPAVAGTSARPGHPHRHGAAVPRGSCSQPGRHVVRGSPTQPGVFLPVDAVPLPVPGASGRSARFHASHFFIVLDWTRAFVSGGPGFSLLPVVSVQQKCHICVLIKTTSTNSDLCLCFHRAAVASFFIFIFIFAIFLTP